MVRRVAITGATGFIGQKLMLRLLAQGDQVRILSRRPLSESGMFSSLQCFQGDLSVPEDMQAFVDGVSVVYHCAGEIKDTTLMHALHVEGTTRLLEAVSREIKSTQKPIHWVQLSSVGAYGVPSGLAHGVRVVTETTSHSPVGEYEVTKTLADELVMQFAKTEPLFTYTILRPSNVIGAFMPNQSVRALVSIIKKRLFFYIGTRNAIATYIHVDDVVAALVLCGSDLRARGQIFNLSNDCLLSEVVAAVAHASGVKPPTLCVPEKSLRILVKLLSPLVAIPLTQERVDALVRRTYYPAIKIKRMLGFVPQHDIPKTVASMFRDNWLKRKLT